MKQISDYVKNNIGQSTFLSTGNKTLDSIIGGIPTGGTLITIMGNAGLRTDFMLSLAFVQAIDNDVPVALYDNYAYWGNAATKLLAYIGDCSWNNWCEKENIDSTEYDELITSIKAKPLYLSVGEEMNVYALCDSIRQQISKGVKVFFISTMQDYSVYEKSNVDADRKMAIMLKRLSAECHVTIFVESISNYHVYEREGLNGYTPVLGDLSQVGDLHEFSDIVIGVFAPEDYGAFMNENGDDIRGKIQLNVLKNNRGYLGKAWMEKTSRYRHYNDLHTKKVVI